MVDPRRLSCDDPVASEFESSVAAAAAAAAAATAAAAVGTTTPSTPAPFAFVSISQQCHQIQLVTCVSIRIFYSR